MRINSNGKVGIGFTTTPDAMLDVRNNDASSGITNMINMYAATGDGDGVKISFQTGDGTAHIRSYRNELGGSATQVPLIFSVATDVGSQGNVDAMCIYGNGKVGIGTILPGATLHLNAANAQLRIEEDTDNDYLYFDMVQGGRCRINNNDQRTLSILEDGGNVAIGRSSASSQLHVNGTITESSFRAMKTNISNMNNMLPSVLQMQGVKFDWKEEGKGKDNYGFIAEDAAEILPHVVSYDEEGAPVGIQYTKMTAVLLEAIKEQQTQIDELKSKLN
jgi:hypothetical protein